MSYRHTPAMLKEVISYLNCRPGKTFVDGTLGGSGHAGVICDKIAPGGVFIGIESESAVILCRFLPGMAFMILKDKSIEYTVLKKLQAILETKPLPHPRSRIEDSDVWSAIVFSVFESYVTRSCDLLPSMAS